MTILEKLQKIQLELKVSKDQKNSFGNYKYRSAEDILEALKPFEEKYSVLFKITDELKELASRIFVDSEAKIIDLEEVDRESTISSKAQAIIDFDAKGMQNPQRTGSASSYAKKYALGNLLLIDDTKDSDAMNDSSKKSITLPILKLGSKEFKTAVSYLEKGTDFDKVIKSLKNKFTVSPQIETTLKLTVNK